MSLNHLAYIFQLRHDFVNGFHAIRRLRSVEASGKKGFFKDRLPVSYRHVEASSKRLITSLSFSFQGGILPRPTLSKSVNLSRQ